MAEISFKLYGFGDEEYEIKELISFTLSKSADAPCDGLRLSFISGNPLFEVVKVKAYTENGLIFNGFADTQREEAGENGYRVFIYARSSACLLTDSEAKPGVFNSPSASTLFKLYAQNKGFKLSMPDYFTGGEYIVPKGSSCYSAINSLIYSVCSRNTVVTPQNELTVFTQGRQLIIDENRVISKKRIINRGGVTGVIDFKTGSAEDYSYRFKSRYLEERGLCSNKILNLSAYSLTQREALLKRSLKKSAENYMSYIITLSDEYEAELYDRISFKDEYFGDVNGYYVSKIDRIFDYEGERTQLTLGKQIDLKEIMYVD